MAKAIRAWYGIAYRRNRRNCCQGVCMSLRSHALSGHSWNGEPTRLVRNAHVNSLKPPTECSRLSARFRSPRQHLDCRPVMSPHSHEQPNPLTVWRPALSLIQGPPDQTHKAQGGYGLHRVVAGSRSAADQERTSAYQEIQCISGLRHAVFSFVAPTHCRGQGPLEAPVPWARKRYSSRRWSGACGVGSGKTLTSSKSAELRRARKSGEV